MAQTVHVSEGRPRTGMRILSNRWVTLSPVMVLTIQYVGYGVQISTLSSLSKQGFSMNNVHIGAICAFFFLYACCNAQQNYNGWRFVRQTAEGTVFMSMTDEEAVVTQEVILEISRSGRVKSISYTMPGGRGLDGSQGEMHYYWNQREGINAWWKYMHKNDGVHIHRPSSEEPVLGEWFGRVIACVTKTNKHYVGRLRATKGDKRWFSLEIEGGMEPVKFYAPAVSELHALK